MSYGVVAGFFVLFLLGGARIQGDRRTRAAGRDGGLGRAGLVVAPALLLGAVTALLAPAGAAASDVRAASASAAELGRELPERRGRTSRTYVGEDGRLVSRLFTVPVNFKDAAGRWRTIDNDLRPAGDGYVNEANRYRLELPDSLDRAVRVSEGDAWVEYGLVGATAKGAVQANQARYGGAAPGVDVVYSAEPDAVKEELILAGPESQSSFRFKLRTSPGLRAKERPDGGIDIVDTQGGEVFSFARPLMYDSSKRPAGLSFKVAAELRGEGGDYTIDLRADRAWLEDKRRRWPVVVDPTVTFAGAERDCVIVGGFSFENTSNCGSSELRVGHSDEVCGCDAGVVPAEHRTLLKYPLADAIPTGAKVLEAKLGLYGAGGGSAPVDVYGLTRSWTSSTTWRHRDAANTWTTAGGDVEQSPAAQNASAGGSGAWSYWFPTALVQRWVTGATVNNGFLLRTASDSMSFRSSETVDPATRPFLEVHWEPPTGERSFFSFEKKRLTDRSGLRVNLANGNLLVKNSDLQIAGTGLGLDVTRFYNSLSPGVGSVGRGWTMGTGQDVRIYDEQDGSVTLHGPSGYVVRFMIKSDGSFESPPGLKATLRRTTDKTYELTSHATGEKLSFTSSGRQSWGRLTVHADRYDNRLTFAYNVAGKLSSITDTQGRVTAVTQDAAGRIAKLTDSTGRSMQYAYDSQDRLLSYTDAAGKATAYGYDATSRLTSITTPGGRVTKIAYDAQGRVAQLIQTTDAAHTTGPTTRFSYSTGAPCASGQTKTVVSDPLATGSNGHTTTYCADSRGAITKAMDSSGNTTARSYDAKANLTSETRPGGGVTNYGWDPATQNLLCIQRGATSVQSCTTSSGGLKTTFAYANSDALTKHFPTRTTSPQGHSVALCYNGATPACGTSSGPAGSVQSLTNQLSSQNVRRFAYDARGNLTAATDARGYTTGYGYDAQGNLTRVAPPAGAGLGSRVISPDALGRPRTVTDGKGQTATYTYDALNRVTRLAYPGGLSFGSVYDPDGNTTSLSDPSGTTGYTVDQLARLTREEFPGGASNAYSYDAASNLTGLTDAGGTTTYAYNALNQLASLTEPGDTTRTTFNYNSDGARTQVKYPSGVSVNHAYHLPSGRTLSVTNKAPSGSVLSSYAYTYSYRVYIDETQSYLVDTDLPQEVTDDKGNTTVNTYDALDRLTEAVTSGGPAPSRFKYTFDGNGNRTSQTTNPYASTSGTTETYAYDSAGLPCWRAGGTFSSPSCASPPSGARTYTHDANGNDLDNTHQRFTYNAANQATSVHVIGLGTASFAYRGPGQSQPISDGSYTLQHNLLGIGARADSSSSTTTSASDAGELSTLAATDAPTSYYARADDGTLLSQRGADGRRNYLFDGQGSIVGLTDGGGQLTATYRYYPGGHPANNTSTGEPNPFGAFGAYTAAVQSDGVICGGPNLLTAGAFYDAEDGRPTQLTLTPTPFGIDLPDFDDLTGAVEDLGGYLGNIDGSDLGHAALGAYEVVDGAAMAAGGVVLGGTCFTGVSGAPVVGQIAGYPACTVVTLGPITAGSLSIRNGVNQIRKVDLTE